MIFRECDNDDSKGFMAYNNRWIFLAFTLALQKRDGNIW